MSDASDTARAWPRRLAGSCTFLGLVLILAPIYQVWERHEELGGPLRLSDLGPAIRSALVLGAVALALGVGYLAAGYGLAARRRWGLVLALSLAAVAVPAGIHAVVALGYRVVGTLAAVHGAWLLLVLSRARVREALVGGGAPGPDPQPPAAGAEEAPGWFRDNLEGIVVAVALAIIIRHFAMEAFVIPTGSMAPTLSGEHLEAECPHCAFRFHVGCDADRGGFGRDGQGTLHSQFLCPNCNRPFDVSYTLRSLQGGHKILVNKFIYHLERPRRWDVVVFKYPDDTRRNFIKRLVGLPGETLTIRNGDIYVRDGTGYGIARKPAEVQEATWLPVFDAALVRDEGLLRQSWELPPERWTLEGNRLRAAPGDGATTLRFRRPLKDVYGYNLLGGGTGHGIHTVADVRVGGTVTPEGEQGAVRLAIEEEIGDRPGEARFPHRYEGRLRVGPGDPPSAILKDGAVAAQDPELRLEAGRPARVELSNADNRVSLMVDGREALWVEYEDESDRDASFYTRRSAVELTFNWVGGLVEGLRVQRDIHYTVDGFRDDLWEVPEDSYLVLGDNSPHSQDSRKWGSFRRENLVGRAFLVFWPAIPFYDWQVQRIR